MGLGRRNATTLNATASGRRNNKVQRHPTRTRNGIARPRRLVLEREPGHATNPSASRCSARAPLSISRLRPDPHAAHVTPAKLSCRLLAPPGWSASGLPSLRWRSGQTPPSAVFRPTRSGPRRKQRRRGGDSSGPSPSRHMARPLRSRSMSRVRSGLRSWGPAAPDRLPSSLNLPRRRLASLERARSGRSSARCARPAAPVAALPPGGSAWPAARRALRSPRSGAR